MLRKTFIEKRLHKTAKKVSSNTIGALAENIAKEFLEKSGLCFIDQNYHSRRGEIDLIFSDGDTLAFIEVKYRKSIKYGSGIESINYQKRQSIIYTAQHYLHQHQLTDKVYVRFDVLSITSKTGIKLEEEPDNINENFSIEWIRDAFHSP